VVPTAGCRPLRTPVVGTRRLFGTTCTPTLASYLKRWLGTCPYRISKTLAVKYWAAGDKNQGERGKSSLRPPRLQVGVLPLHVAQVWLGWVLTPVPFGNRALLNSETSEAYGSTQTGVAFTADTQ